MMIFSYHIYCLCLTFSYQRKGLLKQNKRGETETSIDACQIDSKAVEQVKRNRFSPFDTISVHKREGGKIGDVMVSGNE